MLAVIRNARIRRLPLPLFYHCRCAHSFCLLHLHSPHALHTSLYCTSAHTSHYALLRLRLRDNKRQQRVSRQQKGNIANGGIEDGVKRGNDAGHRRHQHQHRNGAIGSIKSARAGENGVAARRRRLVTWRAQRALFICLGAPRASALAASRCGASRQAAGEK